jgi:hypothetical protein
MQTMHRRSNLMWKRNKPHIEDEKLDRLSDELLRAFDASESEINTAATSPFLYRRIRVRIEAEEKRRAAEGNPWLAILSILRRAIPALAMVAMLTAGLSWYSRTQSGNSRNSTEAPAVFSADLMALSADEDDLAVPLVEWDEANQKNGKEQR